MIGSAGVGHVVLVVDRADELLEQVFERDQARHAAILVEHDGHLRAVSPQVFDELEGVAGLGHAEGRPDELGGDDGFGIVGLEHLLPEVLAEQDPDDVVAVGAEDRNPAAAGLAEGLGGRLGRHGRRAG